MPTSISVHAQQQLKYRRSLDLLLITHIHAQFVFIDSESVKRGGKILLDDEVIGTSTTGSIKTAGMKEVLINNEQICIYSNNSFMINLLLQILSQLKEMVRYNWMMK